MTATSPHGSGRPETNDLPLGPFEGPDGLVARTTPIDPSGLSGPVDLLAVAGDRGMLFEREGAGLACRGEALRIELPAGWSGRAGGAGWSGGAGGGGDIVGEVLGRISAEDAVTRPGTGPLAIGALPFDAGSPATLVVPALVVGVDVDGSAWRTVISRRDAPSGWERSLDLVSVEDRRWPPDQFSLVPRIPHQEWCARVAEAVATIRAGHLEKAVLAREVVVEANRPFLVADVLERLRTLYPSCTTFSVDGFVGASPELLVGRRGRTVRSHPLAGTVARSGDPEADRVLTAALLASAKERHEHQVVVDAVAQALGPLCPQLDVPPSPSIVSLRNVSHLGTLIEGRLAGPVPGDLAPAWQLPSAIDLATRLHPTPAVAGVPRAPALALISAMEGMDRGGYAGPVGWVDSRGDGDWVIGIRSATLDGATARLIAGVGIVADSVPEEELVETQLKLQALLAAVVRP